MGFRAKQCGLSLSNYFLGYTLSDMKGGPLPSKTVIAREVSRQQEKVEQHFFFFLKNEKLSIDRDCKCVATEREKGGSHKERIYKNIDIKLGKYNMYSRDHKQSSQTGQFLFRIVRKRNMFIVLCWILLPLLKYLFLNLFST